MNNYFEQNFALIKSKTEKTLSHPLVDVEKSSDGQSSAASPESPAASAEVSLSLSEDTLLNQQVAETSISKQPTTQSLSKQIKTEAKTVKPVMHIDKWGYFNQNKYKPAQNSYQLATNKTGAFYAKSRTYPINEEILLKTGSSKATEVYVQTHLDPVTQKEYLKLTIGYEPATDVGPLKDMCKYFGKDDSTLSHKMRGVENLIYTKEGQLNRVSIGITPKSELAPGPFIPPASISTSILNNPNIFYFMSTLAIFMVLAMLLKRLFGRLKDHFLPS